MKKVNPEKWKLTPTEKKILKAIAEGELAILEAKKSLQKIKDLLDHASFPIEIFEDCLKDQVEDTSPVNFK